MTRKIYVAGSMDSVANWMEGEVVRKLNEADVVVFPGGADVDPKLYDRTSNPNTNSSPTRDTFELGIFNEAIQLKKHIVGICRGAQLCCVKAGGILVQHQANYSPSHKINTIDKTSIITTSDHHQAQYPWLLPKDKFRVLAWTQDYSPFHEDGDGSEMVVGVKEVPDGKEVEVCYYPEIKALAIQAHPEWEYFKRNSDAAAGASIEWYRSKLNRLIYNTI